MGNNKLLFFPETLLRVQPLFSSICLVVSLCFLLFWGARFSYGLHFWMILVLLLPLILLPPSFRCQGQWFEVFPVQIRSDPQWPRRFHGPEVSGSRATDPKRWGCLHFDAQIDVSLWFPLYWYLEEMLWYYHVVVMLLVSNAFECGLAFISCACIIIRCTPSVFL